MKKLNNKRINIILTVFLLMMFTVAANVKAEVLKSDKRIRHVNLLENNNKSSDIFVYKTKEKIFDYKQDNKIKKPAKKTEKEVRKETEKFEHGFKKIGGFLTLTWNQIQEKTNDMNDLSIMNLIRNMFAEKKNVKVEKIGQAYLDRAVEAIDEKGEVINKKLKNKRIREEEKSKRIVNISHKDYIDDQFMDSYSVQKQARCIKRYATIF